MASTLKINTLTGVTTAGSIAVTGEGNSTTTNLQQGLCKAWMKVDGTGTAAIDDSFSVSSLSDNGTGDYTATFASAMSNASYAWPTSVKRNASSGGLHQAEGIDSATDQTSSSLRINTLYVSSTSNRLDIDLLFTATVFGDLA